MLCKSWNKIVSLFLISTCSLSIHQVAHADLAFGDAVYDAGDILLDFTDFGTRLDELAVGLGEGAGYFTPAEQAMMKADIETALETAFSDFSSLVFSPTPVGGAQATIVFGLTASPGSLGLADHIDFLNVVGTADTARVFTANFGFIVETFEPKATQVAELTAALAGTAVHEVAHNLGLRHHDAYSDLTYDGTVIADTGGVQNSTVMATGSTGLTEAGREVARTFSQNSLVKLAYASGTLPSNPGPIPEEADGVLGDAGGTTGTAQALALDAIPIAGGLFGKVVQADFDSVADVDVYSFTAAAGASITVDVNNDYFSGSTSTNANTFIELIDPTLAVIASDDVSAYANNTYGSGASGDGFDPAVFNIPAPSTGTYYVRVTAEDISLGTEYTLLLHTTAVPEPSAFAFMGLVGVVAAVGGAYGRRRKGQDKEVEES